MQFGNMFMLNSNLITFHLKSRYSRSETCYDFEWNLILSATSLSAWSNPSTKCSTRPFGSSCIYVFSSRHNTGIPGEIEMETRFSNLPA